MYKLIYLCGLVFCCITSCKTVAVHHENQKVTKHQQTLGSIGTTTNSIINSEFNNAASPVYKTPLKVIATIVPFTKQTYKAFLKAKSYQVANVSFEYVDSLMRKPKFVQFQIVNKVGIIDALNDKTNIGVKDYLSHQKDTALITDISVALNYEDFNAITTTENIFLIQNSLGNYVLHYYSNEKISHTLRFNQGVVFAYKAANSCWQENSKLQLNIVDLVDQGKGCPRNTFKSAHKAKSRVDYFKL